MSFEQPEKSEVLKKAEEEDARLAKSLSPEENFDYPRPATVSPEEADEFRDSFDEIEKVKDNIIEFPKKSGPEEPEKKKAA